jgi:uncharacterized membrane protein
MRLIRLLKNDLAKEATDWVDKGLISSKQAELICARYGIDYNKQSKRSLGYFVLITLGYLFIGLALITLLSANWDDIPRSIRMIVLILVTLSVNIFALNKFRNGKKTAAVGYFFLGGLFYGASIMLIAQIYHIGEHYPDGIFWWAMGVLPIALLLESTLIMLLAIVLGFTWFFVESSLHYYPALFPVFLAASAWHIIRVKQSNILFLVFVAGLGFWAEYFLSWSLGDFQRFSFGVENISLVIGMFVLFHGSSRLLISKKEGKLIDYGTLLNVWTLRFAIISLLIFSFREPWLELIKAEWEQPALSVTLAICMTSLAIWLVYSADKKIFSTAALSALYIISIISVMVISDESVGPIFQFADNIVLVVLGIWLIVLGIQNAISHYFFLGVFVILVTGLLRYIDLLGDYIGATILFAVCAAILLASAKFWKRQHSKARLQS